MYEQLKGFVKKLVPKHLLNKYELPLRRVYAKVFYHGNTCSCNLCESQFSNFILLPSGDLLCPVCGSIPRNRRLWQILSEELKTKNKILHFSPSRVLYRKLKQRAGIDYVSTDFEEEFIADHRIDITNIDFPDLTFDNIICFHILEHIPDDQRALQELYRVLKPGGLILLQTPFKVGEIYEDTSIISEVERTKHFGQKDHVRVYSAEGLKERLSHAGLKVEVKKFERDEHTERYGLKVGEIVLFARRTTS